MKHIDILQLDYTLPLLRSLAVWSTIWTLTPPKLLIIAGLPAQTAFF